jgi:hypothetical protein
MAYSTHPTKQIIIDVIADHGGEAGIPQFVTALGPEWGEGNKSARLRQMLRQMVEQNILTNPRRGVYSVNPRFDGFDGRDWNVRHIETFLTERWGGAKTDDIMNALGAGKVDAFEVNAAARNQVTYALARTPDKFCQDWDPMVWTLKPEARRRLPLLGRWAEAEFNLFRPNLADAYFAKIGEAFTKAREARDLDSGAVIAERGIRAALLDMASEPQVWAIRDELLGDLRTSVAREMAAKRISAEAVITDACEDRKDEELALCFLRAFECGDARVHRVASQDLYRTVTAFYGIDPVSVTWTGEVVPVH